MDLHDIKLATQVTLGEVAEGSYSFASDQYQSAIQWAQEQVSQRLGLTYVEAATGVTGVTGVTGDIVATATIFDDAITVIRVYPSETPTPPPFFVYIERVGMFVGQTSCGPVRIYYTGSEPASSHITLTDVTSGTVVVDQDIASPFTSYTFPDLSWDSYPSEQNVDGITKANALRVDVSAVNAYGTVSTCRQVFSWTPTWYFSTDINMTSSEATEGGLAEPPYDMTCDDTTQALSASPSDTVYIWFPVEFDGFLISSTIANWAIGGYEEPFTTSIVDTDVIVTNSYGIDEIHTIRKIDISNLTDYINNGKVSFWLDIDTRTLVPQWGFD